jgi:hypothetical protein
MKNATHFIGFRDDRFNTAIRVFGKPDFIHRFWDYRATVEVAPGDRVIFADKDENQPVNPYTFDDSANF